MRKFKYIYVSGPMTGIPKLNIPLFNRVTKLLRKAGHLVLNPAELDGDSKTGMTWEECLRRDLRVVVQKCYALALLPGWKNSRGAKLEVHVAKKLGMKVHDYEYYL